MLSKIQKIWLGIFGAMFLIPEILWSPIMNFSYTIWESKNIPTILRNNFLIHSDYRSMVAFVVLIQCIGLLSSLILILRSKTNFIFKIILSIILSLLFILSLLVFIFLSATINMGS